MGFFFLFLCAKVILPLNQFLDQECTFKCLLFKSLELLDSHVGQISFRHPGPTIVAVIVFLASVVVLLIIMVVAFFLYCKLRDQQSWHGEKHRLHPSPSPLSSQQNGRSSLGLQSAPLDGSNTDDQQGNKIAKVPFLSWLISQTTKRTHPDEGLPSGGRYGECSSTKQGKHSNLRGCCDRRIS